MKLPFHSNVNRHFGRLSNILRCRSTKTLERKLHRNPRSFQASISCLYRQSLSLLKKEKAARVARMKIDNIRREAERIMRSFSHSMSQPQPVESDDNIDVGDDENSEIIVTQDDLDGEEQLERLEHMTSLDSGMGSLGKSSLDALKTHADSRNDLGSDPLDLSFTAIGHQTKQCTPPRNNADYNISPRATQFDNHRSNIVTSTPIINNLPSRRSADDHLEQFMMVDPNQNIKWKQLADKFNKELGPNVCGVCHKTLSCKSALTMHYRVHTEERPFVCKVCEKRFSTKGNLKTHLGQHADVTDQYCMGNAINSGQFKQGNLLVPPSAMSSPTAMNNHHQRLPLQSSGFPFGLPGLGANPHLLLNMFSHPNGDFNMMEAIKASQKIPNTDINSNFVVKTEENGVNYLCNLCRQNFPTKLALEIHFRSHNCTKDFFSSIQNGKFPINWKERMGIGQQVKHEGEVVAGNNMADDSEQSVDLKNNAEKFALTAIMGLHNHPGNLFSFMNGASMLHRPMMPPFPGFNPALVAPNHPGLPRMPLSMGPGPNSNFGYNYSDLEK